MELLVGKGDRLILDVSLRATASGEMGVLWDRLDLVVKRVEAVGGNDPPPPGFRLISANPVYASYVVPAQDVQKVGKLVWVLRKARASAGTTGCAEVRDQQRRHSCTDRGRTGRPGRSKFREQHG